jgi:predicted ATP-dependent endonuclease of OLD family
MILTRLLIYRFGPFAVPATLEIEPEVTVLTGPNDTGKSCILRLIQLIFSKGSITQKDVNVDNLFEMNSSWDKDTGIQTVATFTLTDAWKYYFNGVNLTAGDIVEITIHLAPAYDKSSRQIRVKHADGRETDVSSARVEYPHLYRLSTEGGIRPVLAQASLNSLEKRLITIAFGENAFDKLSQLDESLLYKAINDGNERLAEKFKSLFPKSMPFEFRLYKLEGAPLRFSVSIRDSIKGETPLDYRGAGAQKFISLAASLLDMPAPNERYLCVIFDEPETSLHADSQHFLRLILEELGSNPYIQVIYTTHSPSMVNPLRPESLRLITRTTLENKATSQIDNRPVKENYLPVRVSLGLTPADSLLYAPVTLIVEGLTEILCLPFLLKRFIEESVEGFEDLRKLLPLCHFIDGQGDSFEYWCRLAKSQKSRPIIFVDGDKIRRVKQERLEEKHPDVPVITLNDGQEFEEVVDRETYFNALKVISRKSISTQDFNEWNERSTFPKQMMFSKKVDRWLQDTYQDFVYDKAEVMKKAIETANLSGLNKEPFLKLVGAISEVMSRNSD